MNGVIVIDKPAGFTSFDVVAVVRGILREKKLGHSGTLDPMATGVLPVLVGRAAKAQSLLPDTDKEYVAGFRLGITTDTLDITGKVLSECIQNHSAEDIEAVLPSLRGDIMQVPPMYSAVQKNGVRLYDLARQGIEVEREARPVCISKLELLSFDPSDGTGSLLVSCSKGTYIRVICDDIGKALGCGCIMTKLRRTRACGFTLNDSVTLKGLEELAKNGSVDSVLRPIDGIFEAYPMVKVSEKQAFRFVNGGSLLLERLKELKNVRNGELVRVYDKKVFLGLGEVRQEEGELAMKKLFYEKGADGLRT